MSKKSKVGKVDWDYVYDIVWNLLMDCAEPSFGGGICVLPHKVKIWRWKDELELHTQFYDGSLTKAEGEEIIMVLGAGDYDHDGDIKNYDYIAEWAGSRAEELVNHGREIWDRIDVPMREFAADNSNPTD